MTINAAVTEGRGDASLKAVRYSSSLDGNTNVIIIQGSNGRPRQPTPRPFVDEPPPSCQCSWPQAIARNIKDLYRLWKRFCRDPFRWQILKSTLWFTLALTLFKEMRGDSDDPTNSIEV